MRYLIIILLFVCIESKAEPCMKMLNGVLTRCTEADSIQRVIDNTQFVADSSENNKRARFDNGISNRRDKLARAYFYASKQLTNNQYKNFVGDTRNERSDYIYVPDSFIDWLNGVVFSGKNYYSVELRDGLLNRLQ